MKVRSRIFMLIPIGIIVAGLLHATPAHAVGGSSRTWVSGVGDDFNPCSRTAPCKTFAGALMNTAQCGEIDVLDQGAFGNVTISQCVTIQAVGVTAGVLVSGLNGILINAAPTDHVNLIGLDIDGFGGFGLNGIRITRAGVVHIQDTHIFGFSRSGIDFEPVNAARLIVDHSVVENNAGVGLLDAPVSTGAGRVRIEHSQLAGNGCGLVAASFGADPAFNFAQNCGTNTSGTPASAANSAFDTSITGNTSIGVLSNGNLSTNRLRSDAIEDNGGKGLAVLLRGKILSFGDNTVFGNSPNGHPTRRARTV